MLGLRVKAIHVGDESPRINIKAALNGGGQLNYGVAAKNARKRRRVELFAWLRPMIGDHMPAPQYFRKSLLRGWERKRVNACVGQQLGGIPKLGVHDIERVRGGAHLDH